MDKFFSVTYEGCRHRFKESASKLNAELKSFPISNFTIDVAIFYGRSDKFLVHISGTHGKLFF
jgi:hypothetical protein